MTGVIADDVFDAEADEIIRGCLDLTAVRSFFLYAGAGSGKTRSLVQAVRDLCRRQGRQLTLTGQKVAVITYTNAACDEILQRLEFDPRVDVSTIHAFAWSLIRGYDADIRRWLDANLLAEIAELEDKQARGRASKASVERAQSIESKTRRRQGLPAITRFVYSPTGDNRTRDSLNHAEVIAMTAEFLTSKPGLRRLLVARYPVLLIDESQDTARRLMDALLGVQVAFPTQFCLGLFGDTMQRIYADGKVGLAEAIPEAWARPRKAMNHRCPKRVITLINKIRAEADGQAQRPRSNAQEGTVRLFLSPEAVPSKSALEASAAARMAELTGDEAWLPGRDGVKTLALEHLMSARRFGFERFFGPLYRYEPMRTGLLGGNGSGLGFFTRELLPLANALVVGDRFAIASAIRRSSPLLDRQRLATAGQQQQAELARAKAACDGLRALLVAAEPPSLRALLRHVAETNLFVIPDVLQPFVPDVPADGADAEDDDASTEGGAWRRALDAPFSEIERYDRYVRGVSQFDTHQGVKGREFDRVMVVISDDEAGGFLFSYGKLIGTKAKTRTDIENETAGNDTSIDRTRRLFYVTCSRAEKSLAIVYYSDNPGLARANLIERGWFTDGEIEVMPA
ncbi:DNA helicase-2/ATP-dependent DNA helicase PcrA [Stella humosa]|uniref:DNA helicase-2/ATP-dependent DNA helicase PcrA n=1 Tax=Stella humosa TaxID=94 RepID=A0A3N1MR03_9PROT|nr:UvrD-helicase domain-containing protein [Stella humosa]ROQ03376.1 DNA helicase-2/ATP-dependent DNA helicase PcrA [Stella humosa]BBK29664.1 DNA helicase II [Stella humosa]